MMQTGPNVFTFISPSNDFRFLDSPLLKITNIKNYDFSGPVSAIVGLTVGYGSNMLNAFSINNRLILNNGSHRAYALFDLGIKYAPCTIQKVTRPEELELLSVPEVQTNIDRYINNPRPPILKDYFDPLLRKIVKVQKKNRMVRIQYVIEQSDIPAN
jgi:hypothetical protein